MKLTKLALIGLTSIFCSGVIQAAAFTCPDVALCNGNTFAVSTASLGSNLFAITVSINTTGYTGGAPAGIGAIEIKSFTNSATYDLAGFTTTGGLVSNSSIPWVLQKSELSANGCADSAASGTSRFCADNIAPFRFTAGDNLSFVFKVQLPSGGLINSTLHLKYLFLKQDIDSGTGIGGSEYIDDWKKAGSLGSFDIANGGGTGTAEEPVPEPSTFALLGGSLIALGLLRRR